MHKVPTFGRDVFIRSKTSAGGTPVRREASTGRAPFLSKASTTLDCGGRGVRDVYFEKISVQGRRWPEYISME